MRRFAKPVTLAALALPFIFSLSAYGQTFRQHIEFDDLDSHDTQAVVSLNSERQRLRAKINSEINLGQLDQQEAATLRSMLIANARLQDQFLADEELTFREEQNLRNGLSNIRTQIQLATNVNPFPGGWGRGNNIDTLEATIANRLERGRDNGQLTFSEYRMLKSKLNRIKFVEEQMRQSQGYLSFSERQMLSSRLHTLAMEVRDQMSDTEIAGGRFGQWY